MEGFGLMIPRGGEAILAGERGRSGVRVPAAAAADEEAGEVPRAGVAAELAPNREAKGFIRASFPPGAFVSLASGMMLAMFDLLRGGKDKFVVSNDKVDEGK